MTPRLGREINHDDKSRGHPARTAPTIKTVQHRTWGHILHQRDTNSCTGHAGAHALNTAPHYRLPTQPLRHEDALRLYSNATLHDPFPWTWPPDDKGSSGLAVAKAMRDEHRINSFEWCFGIDHLLGALMLGPVMVGTNWHETMNSPNPAGYVTPDGTSPGGHEYLATGYDTATDTITCLNSWGSTWGDNGRFRIRRGHLANLLAAQGDATVLTQ